MYSRTLLVAAVNCGMIFAACTAVAQSPWYITGGVGAIQRMDASRNTTFNNSLGASGPGTVTTTFDLGPTADLGIGYRLPLGFRVEAEFGYQHDAPSSVNPLSTNGAFPTLNGSRLSLVSGGAYDAVSGTINGFYDIPISEHFVPFIGAGVGVLHTSAQTARYVGTVSATVSPTAPAQLGAPSFTQKSGSATDAVILAELGLSVVLDQHWSVVPSYRFEHAFTSGTAFPVNINIFQLGARYSF